MVWKATWPGEWWWPCPNDDRMLRCWRLQAIHFRQNPETHMLTVHERWRSTELTKLKPHLQQPRHTTEHEEAGPAPAPLQSMPSTSSSSDQGTLAETHQPSKKKRRLAT